MQREYLRMFIKVTYLFFLIPLILIVNGCSAVQSAAREHIKHNKLLNHDERAYAIAVYDLYNSDIGQRFLNGIDFNDIHIDPNTFDSPLYQKWGFGDMRDFSHSEIWYIDTLDSIVHAWEEYNAIDLNNLPEYEADYLKDMHAKYGKGPIDLYNKLLEEEEDVDDLWEILIKGAAALSGDHSGKLNDRSLIMYNRWRTAIGGALLDATMRKNQ